MRVGLRLWTSSDRLGFSRMSAVDTACVSEKAVLDRQLSLLEQKLGI